VTTERDALAEAREAEAREYFNLVAGVPNVGFLYPAIVQKRAKYEAAVRADERAALSAPLGKLEVHCLTCGRTVTVELEMNANHHYLYGHDPALAAPPAKTLDALREALAAFIPRCGKCGAPARWFAGGYDCEEFWACDDHINSAPPEGADGGWFLRANIDAALRALAATSSEEARATDALREAIRAALNELGVPGPGYPVPVQNAFDILDAALAAAPSEEAPSA
jgi:hypothetical protein